MKLRINKLLTDVGLGSRRDVEEYVRCGRVRINGRRAQLSDLVCETDVVLFDEVDLPVKELLVEHASLEKIKAQEEKHGRKSTRKGRAEERAESQRILAGPKSAALRKTSRNNPENKRLARLQREQLDEEGYGIHHYDNSRRSKVGGRSGARTGKRRSNLKLENE